MTTVSMPDSPSQQDRPARTACPRCAYDLAGEAARWNSDAAVPPTTSEAADSTTAPPGPACPLAGTCPECGLRFSWALVYRPWLAGVRWFVEWVPEHKLARPIRWRGLRTWAAAFVPCFFWRRVSLEVPHRSASQVRWVLGVAFLSVFLVLLAATVVQGILHSAGARADLASLLTRGTLAGGDLFRPVETSIRAASRTIFRYDGSAWPLSALAGLLLYPLVLVCLPWTRARCKVTMMHLLRATAYSIAPWALCVGLSAFVALRRIHAGAWWPRRVDRLDPFVTPWFVSLPTDYVSFWLWPASILWFLLWWGCALKIGFRMQDWRPVLLALAVPAVLTQVILGLMRAFV